MLRPSKAAYMNPSSFCSISWILGIWNDCLLIFLFSTCKSTKDLKEPSGLEMINMGDSLSKLLNFLNVSALHNLSTSFCSFFSWDWGTRYALAWHGVQWGSFGTRSTRSVFHIPTVSSNSCSCFWRRVNSFCCSLHDRCLHSCAIFSKSALQYLVSRMFWNF